MTTLTSDPLVKHRADYREPAFLVDTAELFFDLREQHTRVRAVLALRRNPKAQAPDAPLVLDGERLELVRVAIDGRELAPGAFELDEAHLTVEDVPDAFRLETEVVIEPQENTALEGLYKSGGVFVTQCEAEGFRRITFYPDRPDVMARFTTTIEADAAKHPVLLSNGNSVGAGRLEDGRHWVKWEDPFKKPCYLFALVAGDLLEHAGSFTTASGREVALRLFVEHKDAGKTEHAMRSLVEAMRWDERRFGLEYDLDVYMIVAVDFFNMGAMENKGLNVFNSKLVLARPDTATDDDYERIESVVAHEYFHNWTGNRVTCRDWFQLSLKEGLTVFRDQEFTSDTRSRAVERIQEVRTLRARQLAEDSGPMAHPVRPESYIEMNNFYTATVYEKGAEVVRMYQTLLGREGFEKGLALYIERHDGQAVTCDDFRAAMADANGRDLERFERWYLQAGTPVIDVRASFDAERRSYTLELAQHTPPTPGQEEKLPLHVPFAVGLLDRAGGEMPLRLEGEQRAGGGTRVLELLEARERFTFVDVPEAPVPSLLRGFSAPVKVRFERPHEELLFLMAHDTDPFNRWEAGQRYATELLLSAIARPEGDPAPVLDEGFVEAFRGLLADPELDRSLVALALTLPGEEHLYEELDVILPDRVRAVRRQARRELARALSDDLERAYLQHADAGPYSNEPRAIGRRRLKNVCLGYLSALADGQAVQRLVAQLRGADNMTDQIAALSCLCDLAVPEREEALDDFHRRWRDDPNVLDKWFTLQAASDLPDVLSRVRELSRHPDFDPRNPNRARSLIGAFAMLNPAALHDASGEGHRFLADQVIALDELNPQVASRLVDPLLRWRRFDAPRGERMQAELERILARPGLSRDVYEKVTKALPALP